MACIHILSRRTFSTDDQLLPAQATQAHGLIASHIDRRQALKLLTCLDSLHARLRVKYRMLGPFSRGPIREERKVLWGVCTGGKLGLGWAGWAGWAGTLL